MSETGDAETTDLGRRIAPWGKELVLQGLRYSSGLRMVRLRIREGRRFTLLDLDADTLAWLTETARAGIDQPAAPDASDSD